MSAFVLPGLQTLLGKLVEEALPPELHPDGHLRQLRYTKANAKPESKLLASHDIHKSSSHGCYLLDSDERAARLAALGTVALFDAPKVKTAVRPETVVCSDGELLSQLAAVDASLPVLDMYLCRTYRSCSRHSCAR